IAVARPLPMPSPAAPPPLTIATLPDRPSSSTGPFIGVLPFVFRYPPRCRIAGIILPPRSAHANLFSYSPTRQSVPIVETPKRLPRDFHDQHADLSGAGPRFCRRGRRPSLHADGRRQHALGHRDEGFAGDEYLSRPARALRGGDGDGLL